jgi:RNA polymerase sigma-70 factor (ECF subfamily)
MDAGETKLVKRARAGDREAFDQVTEGCRPWLFGLCLRLLGDHSTAQDAVQEALLLAFRDLPHLREPSRFRAWISRIAVNVCRMQLRAQLLRPAESAERPEATLAGATAEDPGTAGEALARLGQETRRLVLLFYGEGLSHEELAEALSLSTSAIKSRLHRARERLRKEMLAMMSEEQKARLGVTEEGEWKLRTVLLVEPDDSTRGSLLQALRAAGYQVEMLPTGEAALAAIKQRHGQMLILDKHCGEPHWTEVLLMTQLDTWARENLPVAVLVDSERDVFLAWQAGAVICLTRPPQAAEVVKYVDRVAEMWPEELQPRGGRRDACAPGG